ncbi:MAG: glycosyltransferase [Pirellulales bacterium]
MRVLLTHHFPLKQSESGWLVWHWAWALAAAGDEVRLLIVDHQHQFGEPLGIERVVCGDDPNADLTFPLPRFSTATEGDHCPVFSSLSNEQLGQYRECLRRRLDAQILQFDPHVIHAQHVWVLGQLALETGVPYLLNAWGPELVDCRFEARYRTLAEQAAENASRILAVDDAAQREVAALFESASDLTTELPPPLRLCGPKASEAARIAAGRQLHSLYQAVLDARFG